MLSGACRCKALCTHTICVLAKGRLHAFDDRSRSVHADYKVTLRPDVESTPRKGLALHSNGPSMLSLHFEYIVEDANRTKLELLSNVLSPELWRRSSSSLCQQRSSHLTRHGDMFHLYWTLLIPVEVELLCPRAISAILNATVLTVAV